MRKSLPTRFVVAFDGKSFFLRKTLSVTHGQAEGSYVVSPLRWTEKRIAEFELMWMASRGPVPAKKSSKA